MVNLYYQENIKERAFLSRRSAFVMSECICVQTYLKRHMSEYESSKFFKKVIAMKIKNHLNTEQLSHLEKMSKHKEKVNWKDVMGMNRQTLKRGRGGAMKRK
jgi:hypothetical protein